MKLSDQVDTQGLGFREVEERKRLATRAREVAARIQEAELEDARTRAADFCAMAGSDQLEWAAEVIRELEAGPERYLKLPKVEEPRPFVKPKQTTGMVRSIEVNMRDLLLAYESLSRLLPGEVREINQDAIHCAAEALERMGRPV